MSTPQLRSPLPHQAARSEPAAHVEYNVAVGYLRALATVLVIEHHAFLGYCTFVPPQSAGRRSRRCAGFLRSLV
jgi:hypothetical protein